MARSNCSQLRTYQMIEDSKCTIRRRSCEIVEHIAKQKVTIGVIVSISSIFIICIVLLIIFCLCKKRYREWRNRRERQRHLAQRSLDMKRRREAKAAEIMANMQNGLMSHIFAVYEQQECIVCLDKLTKNSNVHVTNECCHIFHSECLFKWYEHTNLEGELRCPHCNTQNTCYSKPSKNVVHVDDIVVHNNIKDEYIDSENSEQRFKMRDTISPREQDHHIESLHISNDELC